jgi:hypothetical protein
MNSTMRISKIASLAYVNDCMFASLNLSIIPSDVCGWRLEIPPKRESRTDDMCRRKQQPMSRNLFFSSAGDVRERQLMFVLGDPRSGRELPGRWRQLEECCF